MRLRSKPASTLNVPQFRRALLRWYDANRRDLPWRRTRDPYAIWVSEIMLQQTRVAAVVERYTLFMKRFPTVEALGAAPIEEVLAVWSGLGYYRRARALHAAAQKVIDSHGGKLPGSREGWLQLPGIGRYTSAAIASIAFDEPVAVVDGNVERVLARVDGELRRGEHVWQRAEELLLPTRPGDFNQAMMELGATVCTPVSPACDSCPVRRYCTKPGADVRAKEAPRNKRSLTYGLAERNGQVYLVQREADLRLMPGMWELPSGETNEEVILQTKHSITNTDYKISVVKLAGRGLKGGSWFRVSDLPGLPLTGLARKVLRVLRLLG